MSNNTQPPFSIGQKVVCVRHIDDYEPTCDLRIKEGEVYTVDGIEPHRFMRGDYGVLIKEIGNDQWFHHSQFAPYNPPRVNAIPELITQPIEERLDVPKINEPVLS